MNRPVPWIKTSMAQILWEQDILGKEKRFAAWSSEKAHCLQFALLLWCHFPLASLLLFVALYPKKGTQKQFMYNSTQCVKENVIWRLYKSWCQNCFTYNLELSPLLSWKIARNLYKSCLCWDTVAGETVRNAKIQFSSHEFRLSEDAITMTPIFAIDSLDRLF